jgi:hypothetical protein
MNNSAVNATTAVSRRRRRATGDVNGVHGMQGNGNGMRASPPGSPLKQGLSPQRRAQRAAARAAANANNANANASSTPTTDDEDGDTTASEFSKTSHSHGNNTGSHPPRRSQHHRGSNTSNTKNPFSSGNGNGNSNSNNCCSTAGGFRSITAVMACVMVSLVLMILFLLQRISMTLNMTTSTTAVPMAVAPDNNNMIGGAATGVIASPGGNMLHTTATNNMNANAKNGKKMVNAIQNNLRQVDQVPVPPVVAGGGGGGGGGSGVTGSKTADAALSSSSSSTYSTPSLSLSRNSKPITFDKPYKDLTFADIPFQATASHAPRCDAPLESADISFTLVTQVSEDRLWMLTQHCQRWPGPISVAVFTDLSIGELELQLDTQGLEYGKCRPHQVAFSVLRQTTFHDAGYPVNALRNLAFSKITTSHFMYADIDFWVSTNLYEVLNLEFVRTELTNDPKLALIVPAFQIRRKCTDLDWATFEETKDADADANANAAGGAGQSLAAATEPECREANIPRMPSTFDDLTELLVNHQSSAFDPTNRGGHGSTSYREWFRMSHGELWDIPCILSNRYEPYVAARWCDAYPPYQEVFTGYGKNKMTQIMQMRRSGYIFSQVGGVFVCHYPHPVGSSREIWNAGREERKLYTQNRTEFESSIEKHGHGPDFDWTQYKRGQVDKLFVEYKRWLEDTIPPTKARTAMCEDQFNDDLKLWLNKDDRIQQLGEELAEGAEPPQNQNGNGGGAGAGGGGGGDAENKNESEEEEAGDDDTKKADDDDTTTKQ